MRNQLFCCVFAMFLMTVAMASLTEETNTSPWLEEVKRAPAAPEELLREFLNGGTRHRSGGRFGKRASEPFGDDSDLVGERPALSRLLGMMWNRSQRED